jgi:YHS domain-containing protein
MFRALIELIITILVAMVARAILTSVMKGFGSAARSGFAQNQPPQPPPQQPPPPKQKVNIAGELHKDPVCGMYVAESTRFQRRSGGQNLYYCSEDCKDKHAMAKP